MKKSNVVFELAPFLDVILILLFLILVQSALQVDAVQIEAQDAIVEAQASIEEAIEEFQEAFLDEIAVLEQRSADFDALQLGLEDAGVVSVSLQMMRGSDNRQILVEAMNQTEEIPLTWGARARDEAAVALNTALAESIRNIESPVVFIVFKFDSSSIFVGDHRLVSIAIHNQRLHNPQLFSAELDLRPQESEE